MHVTALRSACVPMCYYRLLSWGFLFVVILNLANVYLSPDLFTATFTGTLAQDLLRERQILQHIEVLGQTERVIAFSEARRTYVNEVTGVEALLCFCERS